MTKHNALPPFFSAYPSVYAAQDRYQIVIPVRSACVMWATVGKERFDDAVCGVLRSGTLVHRVTIPTQTLDRAGEYVLHWRRIPARKPYFTQPGNEETATFRFRPLPATGGIRVCHVSDTHGLLTEAVHAAENAAKIRDGEAPDGQTNTCSESEKISGRFSVADGFDLMLLTGDVHNHNGGEEQFSALPVLASMLTHGEIPIVYARGNHDTRGAYAEYLPEIAPTVNGRFYYTFRLGRLWGLVLDCGEDKQDDHPEYGFVNDFASYREEETAYLSRLTERVASGTAEKDLLSPDAHGVQWRIVVSHIPFPFPKVPPFDIERGRFAEWSRMIGERIRPDLLISGHLHVSEVCLPGCTRDKEQIQFCPVFLSGQADHENAVFTCGALTLTENAILPRFVSSSGTVRTDSPIPLTRTIPKHHG